MRMRTQCVPGPLPLFGRGLGARLVQHMYTLSRNTAHNSPWAVNLAPHKMAAMRVAMCVPVLTAAHGHVVLSGAATLCWLQQISVVG